MSQPCGGVPAVCRSPLRVPSGRVTCHLPRDVKAAQVGCGVWGRARLGLDARGRLGDPHGRQHLLSVRVTGLTGTDLSLISSQLYREIKGKGYSGSEQTVHRFLRRLREQLPLLQAVEAPPTPVQDFVAKEAVWLFVRDPAALNETEQTTLAAICQASDTARMIYQLVQEFRHMLHTRSGEHLDEWLKKVRASQIRALHSFVVGVERDKAAVVAGLTFPQNNGLVEGKVNKLKLIKRMMFGRAAFPLLRQRVLHAL